MIGANPADTRQNMTTRHKLTHAVTEYDRKQSKKPHYNIYALPQYLQRVDEICADIDRGADVRAAIVAGFTGRLVDVCLRSLDLPITTKEEQLGSGIYRSVTN